MLVRNIVVLISGGGSNMRALVEASLSENWEKRYQARIVAVISNREDAVGLVYAKERGLATKVLKHQDFSTRDAFDTALQHEIDAFQPALVLLAGFMRILGASFVQHYQGRLLNIHPSLLPAFQGLHTHERAIEMGCQFAGATVHEVTAELDSGKIWMQALVPVLAQDTPDSLAKRVLSQEHRIYPEAVRRWLRAHTL
jgi:phosphoribosylglycinamide formyltransferase-1